MSKAIKYILILAFILSIIFLFVLSDKVSMGAVFAGIAGLFASIKSRFFQTEPLTERIGQIEQEHGLKREEWIRIKEEYDSRFRALKARMDYLDYRSAKLKEEIGDLDDAELKALQSNRNLTENEILDKLNEL